MNGVAILARNDGSVLTCTSLPGNPEDHQARYIEAAVQGDLVTSIYLPNGNPQPGPKFNYKLGWFERLIPCQRTHGERCPHGVSRRLFALLAVFLASDESAWMIGEVIRAAGGLLVAI